MKIRKPETTDAEGIARLHVDSWRTTYKGIMPDEYLDNLSYEKWTKMWKSIFSMEYNEIFENFIMYIAENENGKIIGMISGGKKRKCDKSDEGELSGIYLLREYQRRGIGRKLVSVFAESLMDINIKSMIVNVLAENTSRLFYEKLGAGKIHEGKINQGGKEFITFTYRWNNIRMILK